MNPDVIIVGAGVAGMTAAAALGRQGWRVRLVEARNRTGGRVFSVKPGNWPVAAELGAEFVHGGNGALRKVLEKAALKTRRIDCNVWWQETEGGVLALVPDYWERIGRIAGKIPPRNHGWSFQEFLDRQRHRSSDADRRLAGSYVGGFDAAATNKISAHALRPDRAGADSDDLKIVGRYDGVVRELQRECRSNRVDLRLNSPVTAIQWERGKVVVNTKLTGRKTRVVHEARAAIITLPLGVLQSGPVKFSPALGEKQRLIGKLGWGQATRIVLRFRRGFWSAPFMPAALGARHGREFGFVNAPAHPLPVWWALSPPAPVLTGWAGGNAAEALRHRGPANIRDAALRSLAGIFGTTSAKLTAWVSDWRCHQWGRDPFALGAYSFPVAGLEKGAARLAQPIASTLFFAGEATAENFGTVHGAMESGLRVAQETGQSLRKALHAIPHSSQ